MGDINRFSCEIRQPPYPYAGFLQVTNQLIHTVKHAENCTLLMLKPHAQHPRDRRAMMPPVRGKHLTCRHAGIQQTVNEIKTPLVGWIKEHVNHALWIQPLERTPRAPIKQDIAVIENHVGNRAALRDDDGLAGVP